MRREDYIKLHALVYHRMCKQRQKLGESYHREDITLARKQKINVDITFLCMEISKTEERLLFALGALAPDNARKVYEPTAFHRYDGIGEELKKIKLDL